MVQIVEEEGILLMSFCDASMSMLILLVQMRQILMMDIKKIILNKISAKLKSIIHVNQCNSSC